MWSMVLRAYIVQPIIEIEVGIKSYVTMMIYMVCGLAYIGHIYGIIFVCHLEADN